MTATTRSGLPTSAIWFTAGLLGGALVNTWTRNRDLHTALTDATRRADHDPLTGLLTRDAAHRAYHGPSNVEVVALADLDRFKEVNDDYGHQAGDALLAEIGARLHRTAQHLAATAARLGGDEFLLLLTTHTAPAAASSLLRELTRPATLTLGHGRSVVVAPGASIGLADSRGLDWAEALRRADIALYHAKTKKSGPVVAHRHGLTHPERPTSARRASTR